jgi:hypothetical protein
MKLPSPLHIGLRFIATAGLLLAAAAASAIARDELPARIQVTWAPTDQLTEVKANPAQRGWMAPEVWQQRLSEHLRTRADRILPPGEQLQVMIEDISLAGRFEPWHHSSAQDIRFMRDVSPPRMRLHYTLTAADGSVIRQSDVRLMDAFYLQRAVVGNSTDALRFDKRMIDDWLARDFAAPRS